MYVAVEIFRVQKQVAKTIKKAITYNNNIHKEMKDLVIYCQQE